MSSRIVASVSERLSFALDALGMKQIDLAEKSGIDKGAISSYLSGRYAPKSDKIYLMAKVLGVDPVWLTGFDVPMHSEEGAASTNLPNNAYPYNPVMHRIPILGVISAGLPLYAEQHIEGYTYTDLNGCEEYFALRVKGDSMNAARINDNDVLIIRKQDTVENGEIAVVMVGANDAVVKRFYQNGNNITLVPQSTNPQHLPQMYDLSKTKIKIIGKVVRNQIDF